MREPSVGIEEDANVRFVEDAVRAVVQKGIVEESPCLGAQNGRNNRTPQPILAVQSY